VPSRGSGVDGVSNSFDRGAACWALTPVAPIGPNARTNAITKDRCSLKGIIFCA